MSRPILKEQGSFAFGGTVITSPEGDTFHGDHGFAKFQIPPNARHLPLVMWHGGGQFSKTWESTPDGRDGYQQIFTQQPMRRLSATLGYAKRGEVVVPSLGESRRVTIGGSP